MIRWEIQKTLWKSFLKKRVKPLLLAKQESWRQKSICWNCYKQNLRNKSLKNQKSSTDFQDFSAKRRGHACALLAPGRFRRGGADWTRRWLRHGHRRTVGGNRAGAGRLRYRRFRAALYGLRPPQRLAVGLFLPSGEEH